MAVRHSQLEETAPRQGSTAPRSSCAFRCASSAVVAAGVLSPPDGSQMVPTSKPQPEGALVKALARAWRWQRMLDEGVYATVREIGDAENISKSYMSRILRLALLAPDIIEAIVVGKADQSLMLEGLERPLPVCWVEQRWRSGGRRLVRRGSRSESA
jgi:hypothetical protein